MDKLLPGWPWVTQWTLGKSRWPFIALTGSKKCTGNWIIQKGNRNFSIISRTWLNKLYSQNVSHCMHELGVCEIMTWPKREHENTSPRRGRNWRIKTDCPGIIEAKLLREWLSIIAHTEWVLTAGKLLLDYWVHWLCYHTQPHWQTVCLTLPHWHTLTHWLRIQ